MINFSVTGEAASKNFKLIGNECIRRILCYSTSTAVSSLLYKGNYIGSFNINNNIDIEFESYYGFPKISDFSINVGANLTVSILVDVLPSSDVIDDYIEKRPIL